MKQKVAVVWRKLEKIVQDLKEKDLDKEKQKGYWKLTGILLYKKMKLVRKLCKQEIKVCE